MTRDLKAIRPDTHALRLTRRRRPKRKDRSHEVITGVGPFSVDDNGRTVYCDLRGERYRFTAYTEHGRHFVEIRATEPPGPLEIRPLTSNNILIGYGQSKP